MSDIDSRSATIYGSSPASRAAAPLTVERIIADVSKLQALAEATPRAMIMHPVQLSRLESVAALGPPKLGDVPIHEHHMTRRRQVRFPRSKRRRIRKKFAKDPRNWVTEPDRRVYMISPSALWLKMEVKR